MSLPQIKVHRPYAVIVGMDNILGLQTARILAHKGIPIIGVAENPRHPCCRTNVCERIVFTSTKNDELIVALQKLGQELRHRAVVYCCTDTIVLLVSRHRKKLEPHYHLILPDPSVVEMLVDKISFYSYAQREALPIPATFFLHTRHDAERAAEQLMFPSVLKPRLNSPDWVKRGGAKIYQVRSPQELLALYDKCAQWSDVLLAQEWIEGKDADLYSCNCYFNAESKPIVTFIARKLRQWPPGAGLSSLGEECRNETVLSQAVQFFQGVHLRGLGYIEMKHDRRRDKYFIIEPNIGRPTGRSAIAEANGVDLLYAMYCDALGWPLPANLEQKNVGVKWVYLRRDIPAALHYWRKGELSLGGWIDSLKGPKAEAVFSWTDPVPFWMDMQDAVLSLVRRRKQNVIQ
jgi:predicted ATP-grasp superfamily ATP-dependent carboligase